MNGQRIPRILKRTSLSSILAARILLGALSALLCFCGGPQDRVKVVQSLEEAKKLAIKKNTWIVAEFWRHG